MSSSSFPVVGIGASAGGLSAFKQLLRAIPENSGMAYVLVQHLDPNHESLLPEILQKVTNIPVLEISDDIKVKADHIYVIPSNKMMVATDGILRLSPRPAKNTERNLPIDLFFTSLAEVHQNHSIGVVLSGTSSDGTIGLRAIKDHGGITFAQDHESAEYYGMPGSAVQAGVVDFILSPEAIPPKILEIVARLGISDTDLQSIVPSSEDIFRQILSLLRIRKGVDFTYYKQTTIRRRILRRTVLNRAANTAAYLDLLKAHSSEQDHLFQDLLIPVTSFFRDEHIFELFRKHVFPSIIENKPPGEIIRIWVAGCSTGQEVYSIAMCFREFVGDNHEKLQIFGTDLSEPAIVKARTGRYEKSELNGITPQLLEKYFAKNAEGYQVNTVIREMCVFARHNFLKDPPFGKMDLISCRNVLIYMEPYLQKRTLATFHYALNPDGFLLLGKTETTGNTGLFTVVEKADKLFIRNNVPGRFIQLASQRSEQMLSVDQVAVARESIDTGIQKMADEILLRKYTPTGVVVNEGMDILYFRGHTASYLEQSAGKPTHNLLQLARHGLAFELRNIIFKTKAAKAAVVKENIPVEVNGQTRRITLEAMPLTGPPEPSWLVLFHENSLHKGDSSGTPVKKAGKKTTAKTKKTDYEERIQALEQELAQAREDMRTMIQDQDAFNQELQSSNEELLSGSEELQSLNEELETSKEELQSTNEELTVLNNELTGMNEQVTAARNYAESIVATIAEPLLILDKSLRVKSANGAFYKTFKVTRQETESVLVYDLGDGQWNIPRLRELLEEILPQKAAIHDFDVTHNFPAIGERVMLLNAQEIFRDKQEEKLILLSIEDITAKSKIQEYKDKYEKELEEKVRQRTTELSDLNELLIQKNEELSNMNKELQSFAYISSHDLQEPLRKIQTFAGILLQKETPHLSDKGKDYLKRMKDAAGRMQQLIQDLLSFSKINTADRIFESTNLETIVDILKTAFKEEISEKNATIETDGLCDLHIIPFQFELLFQNLISNALKFARPDVAPHISIRAEMASGSELGHARLSPKKKYCHIIFTDNGIGFDPQYHELIFDVFQRLHGREEFSGTGIGLAIVKKIVENHRGVISSSSQPGQGARFDIYIPA